MRSSSRSPPSHRAGAGSSSSCGVRAKVGSHRAAADTPWGNGSPPSACPRPVGDFLEFGPDGTVEFRHHIVRDVAYEGLSYRRRRELHLRAGTAIERLVGDDTESVAEPLSFHFYEGRDYQRAWRYARVAGDRA